MVIGVVLVAVVVAFVVVVVASSSHTHVLTYLRRYVLPRAHLLTY